MGVPFAPIPLQEPTELEILTVTLELRRTGEEVSASARYGIWPVDQDGNIMDEISGDVVPHNTDQENTSLLTYMEGKWDQVREEALGITE